MKTHTKTDDILEITYPCSSGFSWSPDDTFMGLDNIHFRPVQILPEITEWKCRYCGCNNFVKEHLECRKCGAPK